MKRLILILVALVSGLAFVFANGTAEGGTQTISAGEPMTITMGSMGNPNTHTGQSGPFIVQRVEELTDGNLSIDLYDQSKLGQDAALLQQCMDGTVPFVAISMSIFSNFTPMLDVVQLPFLINSYELEKAMFETDEFWALAEAVGEELGVKIVGVGENGMRHFATNGRPINSPEDLHGMIIEYSHCTEQYAHQGDVGMWSEREPIGVLRGLYGHAEPYCRWFGDQSHVRQVDESFRSRRLHVVHRAVPICKYLCLQPRHLGKPSCGISGCNPTGM